MVLSLVLTSCGQSEEEEEEVTTPSAEEETTKPEEEEAEVEKPEMVRDSLGRLVEKPRYGGVIREGWSYSPLIFDSALGHPLQAPTMALTNEHLTIGD